MTNDTGTLNEGMIHIQGGTERDGARFHHAARNSMQFKTRELFTPGIFHFITSDRSDPWLPETVDGDPGRGDRRT